MPSATTRQAVVIACLAVAAFAGPVTDSMIPGYSYSREYRKEFGYKRFLMIMSENPTEREQELNRQAIEQMRRYNNIVFAHVQKTMPDWHKKYTDTP